MYPQTATKTTERRLEKVKTKGRLTDKNCLNAKPKDSPHRLTGSGGMYLMVLPTGGKSWRWKYRFLGKEKLMTFGQYPDVSLADARAHCAQARQLLVNGDDPLNAHPEKRCLRYRPACCMSSSILAFAAQLGPRSAIHAPRAEAWSTSLSSYRRSLCRAGSRNSSYNPRGNLVDTVTRPVLRMFSHHPVLRFPWGQVAN